jgi:Secretion system C-terminal sorting domain
MDYRLTYNADYSTLPTIGVSGQFGHIVWIDFRDGNWEIYYKTSTNGGSSWSSDTRLTNNSNGSYNPFVAASGSSVNVVWYDYRDGNPEIYSKRNPTGNPVGIEAIGSEIPNVYNLSQNYPNPFNPETNIKFSVPKSGLVKLIVYDMSGKEVASLVNQDLNAGSYTFDFNASALASGTYFYRLAADGFTGVKKMVLVK